MVSKIGYKLILIVGGTIFVIVTVFSYFVLHHQHECLLDETKLHAHQLSETIKNSTRHDMLFDQRDRAHLIMETIAAQPGIERVRIFNKDGTIISSNRQDDIGQQVDKETEACYGCHAADQPIERLSLSERARVFQFHPDSSSVLGLINPIYNETSCWQADCHAHSREQTVLGVLDITLNLQDVENRLQENMLRMIVFTIVVLVVISLVLWFFVNRLVGRPVSMLVEATQTVAGGNLNHRIINLKSDEIGDLGRSFNAMTQKLSEAQMLLFQSDKLASLGRLAAGVAHEINNPLTAVLTYSSFLQKRVQNNSEMKEDLDVIVREAKRTREIVKGLLDFARQSVPKKRESDIVEIIDRAYKVVENQMILKHIHLVKNIEPDLPMVMVDASQIQQVFINLLVNAIDAISAEGSTITIWVRRLELSPRGVMPIKKATCSKGHLLIDPAHKIDSVPAIKIKLKKNDKEGVLFFDPIYGNNRHDVVFDEKVSAPFQYLCPKCDRSLIHDSKTCPQCDAAVFSFLTPGSGVFEACTSTTCNWQYWEGVEPDTKKNFIEVSITDSGCGIPADKLSKIFEPFFSTKGQKGTGLGLAVIWGIIDNHDGIIAVDSTVGKGTTFTIKLPT